MKILLPVDGSDYTKRMLSYIAAHDELLSPENDYLIATAVPPIPAHASRFLERGTLEEYYRDQGEQVLQPVRAYIEQKGWKARFVSTPGHAPETIANLAAAEKVDLIVMGTHGHSALGNVVLGSVASGVLARSKQPVLLIP